ncbi:MAG: roadblock/LC7 domain-containing protein [Caldisericaceae bacterium]|nr:roadblock/LC7 domain-containing protein [Caldisericaceae bacterium]
MQEDERLSKVAIILNEDESRQINEMFGEYLADSEAKDIILLNKSGELIAKSGDITSDAAVMVSALAAGVFSATNELARLLGEKEFTITFHQGKETNIHISLITQSVLLAIIFDNHAPIGAIRFWAKKIGNSVKDIVKKAEKRSAEQQQKVTPEGFGNDIKNEIDNLF